VAQIRGSRAGRAVEDVLSVSPIRTGKLFTLASVAIDINGVLIEI
jgi:hypothetical protein